LSEEWQVAIFGTRFKHAECSFFSGPVLTGVPGFLSLAFCASGIMKQNLCPRKGCFPFPDTQNMLCDTSGRRRNLEKLPLMKHNHLMDGGIRS
jgi:hypothetical protein